MCHSGTKRVNMYYHKIVTIFKLNICHFKKCNDIYHVISVFYFLNYKKKDVFKIFSFYILEMTIIIQIIFFRCTDRC